MNQTPIRRASITKYLLLIALIAVALPVLYTSLPYGIDWGIHYRPAALAMLRGESPYEGHGYYNPPWTLLPFLPLALLPARVGRVAIFLISLAGFGVLLLRLHARPLAMAFFLSSSPIVACLYNGNLDWLPLLSLLLPAPFSLIIAAMKPQVGLGIGIYWLMESWRAGGMKTVFWNFLPVSLLVISWPLLYPLRLDHFTALTREGWNMSIFPYGIPVGLYLLGSALAHRSKPISLASSPFFSPYFEQFSLVGPLVALLAYPWLVALASACLWLHIGVLTVLSP